MLTFILVFFAVAIILALLKSMFHKEQLRQQEPRRHDLDELSVAERLARGLPIQVHLDGELIWIGRNDAVYQQLANTIRKVGRKRV